MLEIYSIMDKEFNENLILELSNEELIDALLSRGLSLTGNISELWIRLAQATLVSFDEFDNASLENSDKLPDVEQRDNLLEPPRGQQSREARDDPEGLFQGPNQLADLDVIPRGEIHNLRGYLDDEVSYRHLKDALDFLRMLCAMADFLVQSELILGVTESFTPRFSELIKGSPLIFIIAKPVKCYSIQYERNTV